MHRISVWSIVLRTVAIVGLLGSTAAAWAQLAPPERVRPEGEPFDVSTSFEMEQQPAVGFAIRAGRLFDATTGTNLTNQVVLVKGEVITAVGPADQVQIPAGARVIDLGQATVLPGFIDSHVHHVGGSSNQSSMAFFGINLAQKELWNGFTTSVDMGAETYANVAMRDAINAGWVIGPRMQVVGPQIDPRLSSVYTAPNVYVPFGHDPAQPDDWRNMQDVNSPWLARAAAREHSHYGTDGIKIYMTQDFRGSEPTSGAFYPGTGEMIATPSLTLEEVQAIVNEAHDRGLLTYCHAYGGEGLRNCLEGGVDVPMHVTVGVTKAAGLDDETIRLIKSKQRLDGKPRAVIQTLWDLIGGMEQRDARLTGERATRFYLTEQSFKRLVSEGVTQVHGSGVHDDATGLMALQFEWYVKWGMSPGEAIQVGTINGAEALNYNWGEKLGSIEVGKYADIIAVPGDPLQNIKETENVQFVMKGGVIYRNSLESRPATTDR